jgi:hypothetical protein
MPHTPAQDARGDAETVSGQSGRGTGEREAHARPEAAKTHHLKLSDGSVWPVPALESDEETSVEWRLRYAPGSLTREDHMLAASIISSYGYLVIEATVEKTRLVKREMRSHLRARLARDLSDPGEGR